MTKIVLSLKINIKIYYYTTIKATKYYFGSCKFLAVFFRVLERNPRAKQ